jgi:hypothetical protein
MPSRLALLVVLLTAAGANARAYVVSWRADGADPELVRQIDQQLKAELARRGDVVVTTVKSRDVIVLEPSLEVSDTGVVLSVVGLRGSTRALLGAVRTRASFSRASRAAVARALARRTATDAAQFE